MTLVKKLMLNILNLKLVMLLEYQNIKTFLHKVMFQIGLERFLRLEKLEALCQALRKELDRFTKKNCEESQRIKS